LRFFPSKGEKSGHRGKDLKKILVFYWPSVSSFTGKTFLAKGFSSEKHSIWLQRKKQCAVENLAIILYPVCRVFFIKM